MVNKGIYSVGKDLVKQNITFCQTESFVGPSWVGLTCETGKMIEEIIIKFGTELKPTQYSWKSQLYVNLRL